jgi:hypothetical protein
VVAGGGHVSGDAAHLSAAASGMEPVSHGVGAQAGQISRAGSAAASASGNSMVAEAVTGLAGALARAVWDTGTVVGQLGRIAQESADSFNKVGDGG